jgi:hypothetical protein
MASLFAKENGGFRQKAATRNFGRRAAGKKNKGKREKGKRMKA